MSVPPGTFQEGTEGLGKWSRSGEGHWGGLRRQEGVRKEGEETGEGGEHQCLQSGGEIVRFI